MAGNGLRVHRAQRRGGDDALHRQHGLRCRPPGVLRYLDPGEPGRPAGPTRVRSVLRSPGDGGLGRGDLFSDFVLISQKRTERPRITVPTTACGPNKSSPSWYVSWRQWLSAPARGRTRSRKSGRSGRTGRPEQFWTPSRRSRSPSARPHAAARPASQDLPFRARGFALPSAASSAGGQSVTRPPRAWNSATRRSASPSLGAPPAARARAACAAMTCARRNRSR